MRLGSSMAVVALTIAAPVQGQFPPDSVVNLKVLSEDMTPRQVINVMRGFAMGLGVRCEHCHVGEPGQPLQSFDFPSDEKPTKQKARDMLRMVMAINGEHLANLTAPSDPPIEVTCATCHHGLNKPVTLVDELMGVYDEEGVDAAMERYWALRERYYGSWTYDFTELSLSFLAQGIAQREDYDGAIAILELNREHFPESSAIYLGLARMYEEKGDIEVAIQNAEKSLELNPRNPVAQRLLRQLKGND
jgi:hypothetical protein